MINQKITLKMIRTLVICFIVCLVMGFGTFALAQNKVKILDIIIGGDMGIGLGCKSDSDCKTDEFCHTDQKYCVMCKVPPYEWTGTECECPEGTVEKDGKTCVECLADEHCPLDYSCDTDTNNCAYCKVPPKLWVDNACICPEDTTLQGNECICNQANTELNQETRVCECILDEAKCTGVNFNAEECVCCPTTKPVYSDEECRTCAQLDVSKPVWDASKEKCVQCLKDSDCTGKDGVMCDLSTNTCMGCQAPQVWNPQTRTCVDCMKDKDCAENYACNISTHTCHPCPEPQLRPVWADSCACPAGTTPPKCDCPNGQVWDKNKKQCIALSCGNLGIPYEGLRVMNGYNCVGVGGTIDNGFRCGFSRDGPGPGVVGASGYFYAAKDGNYNFWVNEGNNKYGDVRYVRLYLDGSLIYNASNGNPNGNFSRWVSKGLHYFSYEGDVYKRVTIGLSYDRTNAVMCNYGPGNPQCSDQSTYINPATGYCDCRQGDAIKTVFGGCLNCSATGGYYKAWDTLCYPCSMGNPESAASPEDCNKCPGRYWDGWCRKCPAGYYCPGGQGAVKCQGAVCCPAGGAQPLASPVAMCAHCRDGYLTGCNTGSFQHRERCIAICNSFPRQ